MENFSKDIFELIETNFGRLTARSVLALIVLAVVGVSIQLIQSNIILPLIGVASGLVASLDAPEMQRELLVAGMQLGSSLCLLAVSIAILRFVQMRFESRVSKTLFEARALLKQTEGILVRVRVAVGKIKATPDTPEKLDLLDDLTDALEQTNPLPNPPQD